jgi:hypothetical protein
MFHKASAVKSPPAQTVAPQRPVFYALSDVGGVASQALAAENTTHTEHSYERPFAALIEG